MKEADARAVLLVRAVEEESPGTLAARDVDEARRAAGPPEDLAAFLVARARLLSERLPAGWRALGALELPPRAALLVVPAAGLVLGLASNLLGPEQRIHAIWNPVTLLFLWNLGVYGAAAVLLRRAPRPGGDGVLRGLAGAAARLAARLGAREGRAGGALEPARVRARFLRDYGAACAAPIAARTSRLLALGAVAFALGALGGMILRGVAFDYRVTWASTLLPDPAQRAALVRLLFWPAALALGPRFPDTEALRAAAAPEGAPAAICLAVFGICVAAYVLLPRALWIALASLRVRRGERRVALDLSDPAWARVARPPPPPLGELDPRIVGWFVLDGPACGALASLEAELVGEDVLAEAHAPGWRARLALRDGAAAQRDWLGRWRDVVERGFAAAGGGPDAPRLVPPDDPGLAAALARVRANPNRFAAELVLLELAAFEAYWPLDEDAARDAGALRRSLARLRAPSLRAEVRDTALRRAAQRLGLPEPLGVELRGDLEAAGRALAGPWRRVALGVAAGAAAGFLGFGLAAPFLALAAGKALGLAGAAAVKAGLAAVGGGAALAGAAGGLGAAGGGVLMGGGALLGVGVGEARPSPEAALIAGAKIEVFLRRIVVGRHADVPAARDVLLQLHAALAPLREARDAAPPGSPGRTALGRTAAVVEAVWARNASWARERRFLGPADPA